MKKPIVIISLAILLLYALVRVYFEYDDDAFNTIFNKVKENSTYSKQEKTHTPSRITYMSGTYVETEQTNEPTGQP